MIIDFSLKKQMLAKNVLYLAYGHLHQHYIIALISISQALLWIHQLH